jgi:hypothetical protein
VSGQPPKHVYCIGATEGPIKIGVSRRPWARLADLNIGSPLELDLLWARPGDHRMEHNIHNDLAEWRVRGEWFERYAVAQYFGLPTTEAGQRWYGTREHCPGCESGWWCWPHHVTEPDADDVIKASYGCAEDCGRTWVTHYATWWAKQPELVKVLTEGVV